MMSKMCIFNHNGKKAYVSDFSFNGTVASGYVHGRKVTGEVGSYVYVTKTKANVTAASNAKHFLIDHYEALYGNAPTLKGNRSQAFVNGSVSRIRNTHIKKLGNGNCVATGEVDGVLVMIEYEANAVNLHNGTVTEGKPWLGQARADLIEKHDNTTKATAAANVLLEIRRKDPKLVDELIKKLMIA